MRKSPKIPARQLHSAALRYRPWGSSADTGGSLGWWRKSSPANRGGVGQPTRRSGANASRRRDPRLAQVEAVLLLAREPLSSRRVAQLAGLDDATEARTLIRRLNDLYDAAGRAFRAEEVAGGYQLLSRARFAPWVRRLVGGGGEIRLSQPAMETLAVVAYRQPVLRAEIEAVRGVQCGEILRQLMERSMVRIVGRTDELGRPLLYGTTRKFLQVFGLRHLDELPRAANLRRQAENVSILSESALTREQESHTMTALMTTTEELETSRLATSTDLEEERRLNVSADEDLDEEDDVDEDDDDGDDEEGEEDEWEEVEDDDEEDEDDDEEWDDDEDEDWEDDDDEEWSDDDEDEDEEEDEDDDEE